MTATTHPRGRVVCSSPLLEAPEAELLLTLAATPLKQLAVVDQYPPGPAMHGVRDGRPLGVLPTSILEHAFEHKGHPAKAKSPLPLPWLGPVRVNPRGGDAANGGQSRP